MNRSDAGFIGSSQIERQGRALLLKHHLRKSKKVKRTIRKLTHDPITNQENQIMNRTTRDGGNFTRL